MYYVVASDHRRIHIDHHHNLLRDFRPLDAMPHPKLHSDSNHYFYNIALFWILDQWFYLKWIGCWSDIPHTHLLVITSWSQISSSKSRPTQSISFLCMTSQNIIWMTNGIWRNGWMFANVKEIHIAIYSLSCKKHGILWHITRSIMNRTQNVNLFISIVINPYNLCNLSRKSCISSIYYMSHYPQMSTISIIIISSHINHTIWKRKLNWYLHDIILFPFWCVCWKVHLLFYILLIAPANVH